MGGREYELILDRALGATPSVGDAARVVAQEFMAQPSFVAGSGPFPMRQGSLLAGATTSAERAAVASLYLALVTDVCLGLIEAEIFSNRWWAEPIDHVIATCIERYRGVV